MVSPLFYNRHEVPVAIEFILSLLIHVFQFGEAHISILIKLYLNLVYVGKLGFTKQRLICNCATKLCLISNLDYTF